MKIHRGRTLVLVNVEAGGGRAARARAIIEKYFLDHRLEADFLLAPGRTALRDAARQASSSGYSIVAALGGAGTFPDLLNATFGLGLTHAIVPAGNGNDIASGLGIPSDPAAAAHSFLTGLSRPVDVIRATTHSPAGPSVTFYAGAGGLGLDAVTAQLVNTRFKNWSGMPRYAAAALLAARTSGPVMLHASLDGRSWRGLVLLAAVANAPCYGGGFRIAPDALMDDGWMDVTLARQMPFTRILEALPMLLRGGDWKWEGVERFRARSVTFETASPALFQGDGEVLGNSPVELQILPAAVRILLPAPTR